MLNFNFFRGKKPDTIPPLADAVERLASARQTFARDADVLTQAQAALGNALLNAADDATVSIAREALAVAEVKKSESALTLAAAEAVHKAAQEFAQAQTSQERAAAIDAVLNERHSNAVEIDAAIDALAALVQKGNVIHARLRELNPPSSVAMPAGISADGLTRIIEFWLRYQPGTTYAPFEHPDEARVARYLPGAKPADSGGQK
ncbi:MAG: hypothetical protein HYY78_10470 [Betaproteobacteria bacterium]|nr:hypothetical protein [Betaproteobacteria bacterium]